MDTLPDIFNGYYQKHAEILLRSYHYWTGKELIVGNQDTSETAYRLYTVPFAVVSHGIEADPVFNYGNATALNLFEMSWSDFISMPSRKSAQPVNRAQREKLLATVTERGYFDSYEGVRISATGRGFLITGAVVWNLLDRSGNYCGQAACFDDWSFIP